MPKILNHVCFVKQSPIENMRTREAKMRRASQGGILRQGREEMIIALYCGMKGSEEHVEDRYCR